LEIFLSKVYASFFILRTQTWEINGRQVINTFLQKMFKEENIPDNMILNISDYYDWYKDELKLWDVYLFPFIKIQHQIYKKWWDWQTKNILDEFEWVFYRYVCVMEINHKIVIFTDIWEDFISNEFKELEKIWYKKVELHNIIPKIIESLAEDLEKWNSQVREIWVSFPLAMLWAHANIRDKVKSSKKMAKDRNFKNLIRYWLLDFLKIKAFVNISFNSDNEKDKYNLHWFLYTNSWINIELIRKLKQFLDEIDRCLDEEVDNSFLWLPIYVICWKNTYEKQKDYPYFSYRWNKLVLNLNNNNFDTDDNTINKDFIITWIYPQYLKERKIDNKNVFCYLSEKKTENNNMDYNYNFSNKDLRNIFWMKNRMRSDKLLSKIRDKLSEKYIYINEEEEYSIENSHNHPNFMESDIYLTAISENDSDIDYLINIIIPKTGDEKNEKKKASVSLYKLSWFEFNFDKMEKLILEYNNGNIETKELWIIEKWEFRPRETQRFEVNNKYVFDLIKKCSDANWNSAWKCLDNTFCKPTFLDNKDYIDDCLKLEDMRSLAFIKLLEEKWHKAFFWGKKAWRFYRELADIISIQEFNEEVNINFYHMKLSPFEQKRENFIEASFSHYTVVVWQILEKIKDFYDSSEMEQIINWLEKFFVTKEKWTLKTQPAPNYEIFEKLKKILEKADSKNRKINFNVYFPIKESDYFNLDKLNCLKELWIETNWKRLKIISDIFESNVNNNSNNHKLNMSLNLWVIICKKLDSHIDKTIRTEFLLIDNISWLLK